jgi:CheY-like chemotaxis protein
LDVISRIDAILGEIALERVRKGGLELVVTDLAMPSFNGLRLIQALREMHRDTPVIAVSGQNAEQLTLAEDFGAVATLIKPLDRRLLVSEVERVAGQASSLWNYAL